MRGFRQRTGFWLLWTALPAVGGIGWIQAAIQAQRFRYVIFGVLCLALSVPFVIDHSRDNAPYTAAPMLLAWISCFGGARVMRRRVNTRIRYARIARRESKAWVEEQMAAEYGLVPPVPASPSRPPPVPSVESEQPQPQPAPRALAPVESARPQPTANRAHAPTPIAAEPAYGRPVQVPPPRFSRPAAVAGAGPGAARPQPRLADRETEVRAPLAAEPAARVSPAEAETTTCPDCGESVKATARVCRYCGFRWQGPSLAAPRFEGDGRAGAD